MLPIDVVAVDTKGPAILVARPDDFGDSYLAKKAVANPGDVATVRDLLGGRLTVVQRELCEAAVGEVAAFGWALPKASQTLTAEQAFAHGTRYLAAELGGCWSYGWATEAPVAELELWSVQQLLGVNDRGRNYRLWELAFREIRKLAPFVAREKHYQEYRKEVAKGATTRHEDGLPPRDLMQYHPYARLWLARAPAGDEFLVMYLSLGLANLQPGDQEQPMRDPAFRTELLGLWSVLPGEPERVQAISVQDSRVSLKYFELYTGVSRRGGPPALLYEAVHTFGALVPKDGIYMVDERLTFFPKDVDARKAK